MINLDQFLATAGISGYSGSSGVSGWSGVKGEASASEIIAPRIPSVDGAQGVADFLRMHGCYIVDRV